MAATVPQRIQEHEIWTDLDGLDQALVDAEPLLEGIDPEFASAHASLQALAKYTRTILKRINPVLASVTQLDATDRGLTVVTTSVQSAVEQNDAAELVVAWGEVDPLLGAIAVLPIVKTRNDTAGMTEAIGNFHQRLTELLEDVQARVETTRTELAALDARRVELVEEISEQKDVLANAISGFEA